MVETLGKCVKCGKAGLLGNNLCDTCWDEDCEERDRLYFRRKPKSYKKRNR